MTRTILQKLLTDDYFANKVFPFLKKEYFEENDRFLFNAISKYVEKYSLFPTYNDLDHLISKVKNEEEQSNYFKILKKIKEIETPENLQFLLDETEEYIKLKDLQLKIIDAVQLIQKKDKNINSIPSMLEESLAITFDNRVGLDLNESLDERLEYYQNKDTLGYKCDLEVFNIMTDGGFKKKTLTTIVAQPNLGKSLLMTHLASSFILNGYNVLYITLEMAEEEITKRIDSNILNLTLDELKTIQSDSFKNIFNSLLKNGLGKLIVKEYPTGGANCMHFKALIKDLKQKKNFKPDIIFVDYLGIMGSVSDNMYDNIKKNAEALRGIMVEEECVGITASQTNRQGFDKNSGVSMADIAESTGPLQISDRVIGLSKFDTGTEENNEEDGSGVNKIVERNVLVNILKNRSGGNTNDKFILKQDFKYMRMVEITNKKHEDKKDLVANVNSFAKFSNDEDFNF